MFIKQYKAMTDPGPDQPEKVVEGTEVEVIHKTNWRTVIAVALILSAFVLLPAGQAVMAQPSLSLDFTTALQSIFDYAVMIFTALLPVAAIGIGFTFGIALLSWVGNMIGNAVRFRGG